MHCVAGSARLRASLLIAAGFTVLTPVSALGGASRPDPAKAPGPAAVLGSVLINRGAEFTNSAAATVTVPAPDTSAGTLRLSNDGISWLVMPLTASVSWSVTDEAAGGTPEDGLKTVYVEYGDESGSWAAAGSDSIFLDTVPPGQEPLLVDGGAGTTDDWVVSAGSSAWDNESGLAHFRLSLDGTHWSSWAVVGSDTPAVDASWIDLRTYEWGGGWTTGSRSVWMQMQDAAGNASIPVTDDIVLVDEPFIGGGEGTVDGMRITFPRPAVTGQLFTVRPLFPAGFRMPANAWCQWNLHWGDEEALYVRPNETWGDILFERAASGAGCREWTFTLPYTDALRYSVFFQMYTKGGGAAWGWASPNGRQMEFRALVGTTDRHIRQSNKGIAYLLPTTGTPRTGQAMSYRLYATDASTPPQTGDFWAYPLNCYLNPSFSQHSGSTFTFVPICSGPWVAGWTGTYHGGYMRPQYDPIADGRPPVITAPVTQLVAPSGVTGGAPVLVSWSGRDSASGLYGYTLQMSRNGGAWTSIALATRTATKYRRVLAYSGTYRFRVRARDKAGNWSNWAYGATLRASSFGDTYPYIRYYGGWSTETSVAWSGGSARYATTAGALARFTFSGYGVAWVARRGPDRGIAQVFLDGVLTTAVDLRASALEPPTTVFARRWSLLGTHTVLIKVLGTAGRPRVDVDAFLVLR
jgi:hypothetical protein